MSKRHGAPPHKDEEAREIQIEGHMLKHIERIEKAIESNHKSEQAVLLAIVEALKDKGIRFPVSFTIERCGGE